MAGQATLIVTTRSGARPLGVRGEPLHNAAPQLRRVIRRRLGDASADLLAEPQLHEHGKAIDWYADWPGAVQSLSALPPERRAEVMANIGKTLAEIRCLGDSLAGTGPREESGVVGLSLQLAARAPSESFVFMVGERPVIVCWGYEKEAAAGLLPTSLPAPPSPPSSTIHRPVLEAPVGRPLSRTVRPAGATIPWIRAVLVALPLSLLLIGGVWLLRGLLPGGAEQNLSTREGLPAPPPPEPPRDPLPALRAAFSTEESRGRVLKVELSLIEAELRKRVAECKPPEPPKPPQVAVAPPPPAPQSPQTKAQPAPPPPPVQSRPNDDRLRLPPAPTNNYAFMEGCWRTDPFRHETVQQQPGVSTYCFDAGGNGQLEWRRGRTACRTRAQSRFDGAVLLLRDSDSSCNDGSRWYADQLVCRRGAGDVAHCSGTSRGAYGPVSWTVNLHKLN